MIKGNCLRMITTVILSVMLCGSGKPYLAWAMPTTETEVIRIGVNLELTGGIASFGHSALTGMQLAVREANEEGGILGKRIEFVVRDNKSQALYAQEAMRQLILEEKVVAVLGCAASMPTIAAANWMEGTNNQVPVVTPGGSNPKVTLRQDGGVRDYLFSACFIDPYQGFIIADFATKNLNVKKVAIIADNTSNYSKELTGAFTAQLARNGGSVVGIQYYLHKDINFQGVLEKTISEDPDAIYVPGYYEDVGKIIRQARVMGYYKPILGGDWWDSLEIVNIAGNENLENTFYTDNYAAGDPSLRAARFTSEYRKTYGAEPDTIAVLGYDSAYILFDAMRRSQEITPENVRNALEKTDLEVVTGRVRFGRYHDPIKSAVIVRFIDGKPVFHERINPED